MTRRVTKVSQITLTLTVITNYQISREVKIGKQRNMDHLLLGSSHVNHFGTYLDRHPELHNFGLDICPPFYCFGISGGKLGNSYHRKTFVDEIESRRPSNIYLQVGGNDLDEKNCDVDSLLYNLISFGSLCKQRFNVTHVTVLQFLHREKTRYISVQEYNNLVSIINEKLKSELKTIPHMTFWRHKGLMHSQTNIFRDGIHLNDQGQHKLFKSIRGAMLQRL